MTRKQNDGLLIGRQAQTATGAQAWMPLLCGVTVYALAGLTDLAHPLLPALMGAAVCVPELFPGTRGWYRSALLAMLAAALVLCRGDIFDGFCQWRNGVGEIYTAGTGIVLPALQTGASERSQVVFALWTGAAVGAGFVLLSKLGRGAVCAVTLLLCGGVSLALGKMIDPILPVLSVLLLCDGRGWRARILPVAILAGLVLLSLTPGFAGWSEARGGALRQKIHEMRYETRYTTLPEGRLEPLAASDATALIVTMERPEALYLRGFTGAVLEEDGWKPMESGLLAENQELLYWLIEREFDLRAQFAAACGVETEKKQVTVQNVGACSAYRYIPFTVIGDEGFDAEDLNDTLPGSRYDSFATVYGGAELLPELLDTLTDSAYLRAEAAYREFVKEHYLTVPEEFEEELAQYWEAAEGMDAQSAVRAVLEGWYPDGAGQDPFYATAAVLTLRHFGIPARYCEGYILPVTTEKTVEVTGNHAACWAEVYHDGIGWIPMALTPGLEEQTEQQEPLPTDTPEETLPPETEPSTEPEPEGGYQVRLAGVLMHGLATAVLLLLLLAAALILRRRWILKKRQALLDQEEAREAVTWSFADAVAVLEHLDIHRGNGSMEAMTEPIVERFGDAFAEQFAAASRLNARALFSSRPVTEEERRTVHSFRAAALEQLQANSNRLTRLWMKYILCRF